MTRSAAWLGGAHVVYKLVGFVYLALLTRTLGAELAGTWLASVAACQVVVGLTGMGAAAWVLRAAARDPTGPELAGALALRAWTTPIAAAFLALAVAWSRPADLGLAAWILVPALLEDGYRACGAALIARGRADLNARVGLVAHVAWLGLATLGLSMDGRLPALVLAEWARAAILLGGGWWLAGRPRPGGGGSAARATLPFAGASVGTTLGVDLHPVLLAAAVGVAPVAAFGVAWRVMLATLFVPQVLGMAMAPRVAAGEGARGGGWVALGGGLAALGLWVAGPILLRLGFGETGGAAEDVLPALLLGLPLAWYATWATQVAQAEGRPGVVGVAATTGGLAAVALDLVLVPLFGAWGAAIGRLGGSVVTTAVLTRR